MRTYLLSATFLIVCGSLALPGCGNDDTDLFGALEDAFREGYNFDVCSEPTSEFEACSTCCDGAGFDNSALFNDTECGCTTTVVDSEVCATSNADLDACSACCSDAGFSTASLSGFDEVSCDCLENRDQPAQQ